MTSCNKTHHFHIKFTCKECDRKVEFYMTRECKATHKTTILGKVERKRFKCKICKYYIEMYLPCTPTRQYNDARYIYPNKEIRIVITNIDS